MPSTKQLFGKRAEEAAADFLRRRGYEILDQHVTSRYGEIDILAHDGQTLVALKSKSAAPTDSAPRQSQFTTRKLEKLEAALQETAAKRKLPPDDLRIDVITLDPGLVAGQFSVSHYQGVS